MPKPELIVAQELLLDVLTRLTGIVNYDSFSIAEIKMMRAQLTAVIESGLNPLIPKEPTDETHPDTQG